MQTKRRKPAKEKLTDRFIRAIEPPSIGVAWVYDTELPYFGIRTLSSGTKAFVYGYRNREGRLHRVTLGRWPTLTASGARMQARQIAAKVAAGKDPHEAEQEKRRGLTLTQLVDLYCSRHLSTLRTGDQTERFLRVEAIPWFGRNTKAAAIKRRDIIQMVEQKAVKSPVSANRLLTAMKCLCSWSVERELLDANPAAGIRRPTQEKSRDRVLSEDEISALWNSLPDAQHMTESTRTALRLVLLTAQRPGEVCAMEWSEVDLSRGWWEIPREKTKSDRAHRVPLTRMALELIDARPKADRWVFPSVNGQSLQPDALSLGVRRNKFLGLKRWTPHDLRRTATSHMAAAGVDRFTLERVLNHADSSVTGRYDRYSYAAEKCTALERWERRLRSIIGEPVESKVVEMRR